MTERQLTHNSSENPIQSSDISPDGKNLAYTDSTGIHISAIDTGEVHDFPLPANLQGQAVLAKWFPGGEKLLLEEIPNYEEGATLWQISIFGGTPRKIKAGIWGAALSPQGSSIAFLDKEFHQLWVVDSDGEHARVILRNDSDEFHGLAWSPDGRRIAYFLTHEKTGTIHTVSLDGEAESFVYSDSNGPGRLPEASWLLWLQDSRILFVLHGLALEDGVNLWEIAVDSRTGIPKGKPSRITNWQGVKFASPSASADGRRLVIGKTSSRADVFLAGLKEKGTRLEVPKNLTLSDSYEFPNAWFPDSRNILFVSYRLGRGQIMRFQLDSGAVETIVPGPDEQVDPQISPDGAWIFYRSYADSPQAKPKVVRLMKIASASGTPEQLWEGPTDQNTFLRCPSHADSSCVFSRSEQSQLIFYDFDPGSGQDKEVARTHLGVTDQLSWSISADGSNIAIISPDLLKGQIRVLDLRKRTEKDLQLPTGWTIHTPSWVPDDTSLIVPVLSSEYLLVRIDLEGKNSALLSGGFIQSFDNAVVSPNGRYLAFGRGVVDRNAWLLENF